MGFGSALGEACATFAITNIDDIFVLVTFFAEATTSPTLTPLQITIGQYVGFTVIMAISMVGFGVSLVLPSQPIGFLGLLPILLGFWKLCHLVWPKVDDDDDEGTAPTRGSSIKAVLKVAAVTLMNGGDNIGTYIPLFAQVRPRAEIAIYVVTYYVLLGVWCLAGFLIMRQKHVLRLVQRVVDKVIPFLYMGLGCFIVVKSHCYPWTFERIDESTRRDNVGRRVMAGVTAFVLLVGLLAMVLYNISHRSTTMTSTVDSAAGDADVESRDAQESSTGSSSPAPKT